MTDDDTCDATLPYGAVTVRCEEPSGHDGVHHSITAGVTWTYGTKRGTLPKKATAA